MKLLRIKSQPYRSFDGVVDSPFAWTGGMRRSTVLKAGLIAGGVAALTAGSAAVSALRRRIGESDS